MLLLVKHCFAYHVMIKASPPYKYKEKGLCKDKPGARGCQYLINALAIPMKNYGSVSVGTGLVNTMMNLNLQKTTSFDSQSPKRITNHPSLPPSLPPLLIFYSNHQSSLSSKFLFQSKETFLCCGTKGMGFLGTLFANFS
jgi:hypothetical protein